MRASTALLISLVLVGCRREASVTFQRSTAPAQVEVASRQQLSLKLMVGVGDDVEPQEHATEVKLRARVERSTAGHVVRWLEHPALEGRSFAVSGDEVTSVESGSVLRGDQRADTVSLAQQLAGPDVVQVALMREPLSVLNAAPHVDAAFAELVRRALGTSTVVENASLRLESTTDATATLAASLDATTTSGPVTMRLKLHGTLEVRRADTLPLALSLEGPVEVTSPPSEDQPRVTGNGTLALSRRVSPVESVDGSPVVSAAERLTSLRAMLDR